MAWELSLRGRTVRAEVLEIPRLSGGGPADGLYEVTLDGVPVVVDARLPEPGVMHLVRNGEGFELDVRGTPDGGQEISFYGSRYAVAVLDERKKALLALSGGPGRRGAEELVSTSMPGKVVAVLVELGQEVTEGQGVVVVEAMKMENELRATAPGVVKEIRVKPGEAVEGGAALLRIGPRRSTPHE
jgi:biotin carboxyl carrier protein